MNKDKPILSAAER